MLSISEWLSVLQTIATIGGVILVCYQLRQVEKAIRGEYHDMLSSHMREILNIFASHPELRPYFYENKPRDKESPEDSRALIVSEFLFDLVEHVVQKKKKLSEPLWQTWSYYIQRLYTSRPILQTFITEHKGMYTDDVRSLTLKIPISKELPGK